MNLQRTVTAELSGKQVTCRELTAIEIKRLLEAASEYQPHLLDLLVEKDIPTDAVMQATGLSEDDLMAAAPTELAELYDKVLQANPRLAAMTARWRNLVNSDAARLAEALDQANLLQGQSPGQPAN